MEGELGAGDSVLPISGGDPACDLHDRWVESFHTSLRKIIKTRASFPSEEAALKLLYLAVAERGGQMGHAPALEAGDEPLSDAVGRTETAAVNRWGNSIGVDQREPREGAQRGGEEIACGSEELDLPLSRFPSGGSRRGPGAAGSPHAPA